MTEHKKSDAQPVTETERHDPGAYIGSQPELASDRIPGGIRPQDERVAATQSESAAPGEPEDPSLDPLRDATTEHGPEGDR